MYGYELPVIDVSEANKQYNLNVWLHLVYVLLCTTGHKQNSEQVTAQKGNVSTR
jgi:hypothetical protein